jgi:hypothetical protein
MVAANLADEYAQQFDLPGREPNEAGWAFRARVAYTLAATGKLVLAHEALYNQRESSNPFAGGELSDGYGDMYIMAIAQQVEATLQDAVQQRRWQQRRQGWTSALRFWRKGR